jgi:chemotaxis protein MotB
MVGRKRRNRDDEFNSDRWLVSYADFITLLFAFFTTLYAISTVDAQKMGRMVTSMRASFDTRVLAPGSSTLSLSNGAGSAGSPDLSHNVLQNTVHEDMNTKDPALKVLEDLKYSSSPHRQTVYGDKALRQLKHEMEVLLDSDILKGLVRVHVEPRGLIVSLGEMGVFDSGSDKIKPGGRILLDTIGASLVPVGNHIRIEGNTDNVPINNSKFPSNWELSTARATGVLSYLIDKFGFRPDLLSAAGYAEYRPVAANDTPEGRACNRRVDIVLLSPAAAQTEP